MPEYFICMCLFLFALLDSAVNSQVSFRDKTQAFFQHNNNVRYIVDTIAVPTHGESAAPMRIAMFEDGMKPLIFSPPLLDFKERNFGSAHSEKVVVHNTDRNRSVQLLSISGHTLHVQSSFFEDKVIPPLGNTSFQIVFMVRIIGPFTSHLYIHTSEGIYKFVVRGIGKDSPYRLQPIVITQLPFNGVLRQPINIHNPHTFPITVVEVLQTNPDFKLELPTGRGEGSQSLWKISPYSTKTIMVAQFKAAVLNNHTAYIRVKMDHLADTLFIPLDVTVTPNSGLYIPQDKINFGLGGSLQDDSTFPLQVLNCARRAVKIHTIETEPCSEAIKVIFEPVKVYPNNTHLSTVATLTIDWGKAAKENLTVGKIHLKAKGDQLLLVIPFSLDPLEGGLSYKKSMTTFWLGNELRTAVPVDFTVHNDFKMPIAISRLELQSASMKHKAKVLKFVPMVLPAGESTTLVKLGKPGTNQKGISFLIIHSNISTINVTLNSYDGKLHPMMLSLRTENELDLGLVGRGRVKEGFFALLNLNPLAIEILRWKTNYHRASLQLLGIDKEKFSVNNLLARTSFSDYDRSNLRILEAGSYAVFRLQVEAPNFDEAIEGEISVQTEYEEIKIPFHMTVLFGSLDMVKDSLVLPDCFPGKHCFATVQVQSTFPAPMLVESVVPVPHTSDVRFFFAQLKQGISKSLISPSSTSSIGHVLWGGKEAPADLIYVEGYADPASTPCMQLLGLPPHTKAVDVSVLHRNWERFKKLTNNGKEQWKNYTFWMDTTAVRNFPFEVKVRLSWPRFTNITDGVVRFPLTQVGNTTKATVEIINSASTALLLHVVLEDDYPEAADLRTALPPKLFPHCSECNSDGSENFGISFENAASSDEPSLLREAGVHPNTRLILLGPLQSTRIIINFTPIDSGLSSSMLIIRNSLTVLEVLMLKGKSTRPQLRFSNRLPGSTMPFNFEVPEKLLKECDRVLQTQNRRVPSKSKITNEFERASSQTSVLTIKRFFMVKNSGALPIMISGIFINGAPCEGYGFHIVDCAPFLLLPNEGRKLDIAHTPGFTFSRVRCLLEFHTSMGFPVNFTLESFVPAMYLRPCYSIMPRPHWEGFLLTISSSVMTFLLFSVLVVAFIESDKIMQAAFLTTAPRRPRLDLNTLDNGAVTIDEGLEQEELSRGHESVESVFTSPVYSSHGPGLDPSERPQWIRNIIGSLKDKSGAGAGARSTLVAAAQAAVAQATAAHAQEDVVDTQATGGIGSLKAKKKAPKKEQVQEDSTVRRNIRQSNTRKSKNFNATPIGATGSQGIGSHSSVTQNYLKHQLVQDGQICAFHSKGNGSKKDKRQRKHAKCTCKSGSFSSDTQPFDENEEKSDLLSLEDEIHGAEMVHEADRDLDLQFSVDLDADRDTHTDEQLMTDSERETSLDRGHVSSGSSIKRLRDQDVDLDALDPEWQSLSHSVSVQNSKGVRSCGKKLKDQETQQLRHEQRNLKSQQQQETEASALKQNQHSMRLQQQAQLAKRSQPQANRHQTSDQQPSVRIDSMTVRNRSSWKQSRNTTTSQPSSSENKRTVSDIPKSPVLELPYNIKSLISTGTIPTATAAVTSGTGTVFTGRGSTESNENSSNEILPAAQPPPVRTWEKSFSEMVARSEPQQMYSTVARLGNKTAAQNLPSASEGSLPSTSHSNEKSDGTSEGIECGKYSSSPVTLRESTSKSSDSSLDGTRQTCRGEISSNILFDQNDGTKPGKELGPIGPRKKAAAVNTAVITPWADAKMREQKDTASVSSSLYLGDKFESFKPSRTEQFNEDLYEPFKQGNHVSLRGKAEPAMDLLPSYECRYQYHDGEGQYRTGRAQQSPVQYDQGSSHYLGPSHNVGRNFDQSFDHSPDLSIDSSSDHSREPSTEPPAESSFDQSYDHSFEQPNLQTSSQQMLGSHHQLDLLIQQLHQQSLHSHRIQQYTPVHSVQLQQPSVQTVTPPSQQQLSQPVQQQQSHLQQQVPVHLYPQQKIANQNMVLVGGQRNLMNDNLVPFVWLEQQTPQQLAHSVSQQQPSQQPPPTPSPPPPPPQEQIQSLSQMSQPLSHVSPPQQYQQHGFTRQPSLSPQTASFTQQMQQFQSHQQLCLLKDEQMNRTDKDIRPVHFRENWPPTWENNAQLAVGGPISGSSNSRGACGPLGSAIVESCLPKRDSSDQLQSPDKKGSMWGAVGEARAPTDLSTVTPCTLSTLTGTSWSVSCLPSVNSQHIRERTSSGSCNTQEEATFDPFRSRTISNIWKTPGDGL